jgi:putative spermidine/putrescine transport system ATP-binding protein
VRITLSFAAASAPGWLRWASRRVYILSIIFSFCKPAEQRTMTTDTAADGAAAKLRVERVSKTYKGAGQPALMPTSLTIAPGEFLTLLGPSGSGKTTLLSIVAGLLMPDTGDVWIGGKRATQLPAFARDIGMVFQNYALFPHLTVFDNIAFPLQMRRRPQAEIDREVRRVLEAVELPHTAARWPSELSGGQQQRIALARCMVYRPSIILMDEPLGALDKKLREQIQIEIRHLHEQFGITILYVTHDQQEALALSDRICLMNRARVEQIGTPGDLYFRPATVFAANFLGESNIVRGRAGWRDGVAVVASAAGEAIRIPGAPAPVEGSEVHWMVRPENVRLVPGAPDAAMNAVRGVVTGTIFAGDVTKLLTRLPGGEDFMAKHLTSRSAAPSAVGDEVWLQWDPAETVLLRDEASAGAGA